MMTLGYQKSHSVNNLRKCPWCGLVWTKVAGCDGETVCGRRVNMNESRGEYATFSFTFRPFSVKKLSKTKKVADKSQREGTAGCGKKIVWKEMAPVELPKEFENVSDIISVSDVAVLPKDQGIKDEWQKKFEEESKKHAITHVITTTTTTTSYSK